MKKSKESKIILILSIIFSIICIIAVWILKDGISERKSHPNIVVIPRIERHNQYNHNDIKPQGKIEEKISKEAVSEPLPPVSSEIENSIKSFFREIGATVKDDWTVEIPTFYSLTWIRRRLNKNLGPLNGYLKDDIVYIKDKKEGLFTLKLEKSPSEGKVAIIIDDTGRATDLNNLLRDIKLPLNISILPKQRKTTDMSIMGEIEGWDVLLHLPMEPREKKWIDGTFIKIGMSEEEIKNKIYDFLTELPYVQGVNNHMGSAATQDRATMRVVLNTLKGKGLYFIDSLTISNSSGEEVAKELNFTRFLKRDIFLDNNDSKEYIIGQIDKLIEIAKGKGIAIGIGHLRKNTLEVIRDYNWKQSSIELVVLEELFI